MISGGYIYQFDGVLDHLTTVGNQLVETGTPTGKQDGCIRRSNLGAPAISNRTCIWEVCTLKKVPSGNLYNITMENHHFQWENRL